jgi:short-subunit dehydrogenase
VRVVITGASSGIGEALARHYASPDSVVALICRRPFPGALPGIVEHYPVDVTDTRAVLQAAQHFLEKHGAPDLVIANAGVSSGTRGEDVEDVEKLRRVLEVNVTGLAATLAVFAPSMRAARHGTLVGVSSVAGFRGIAGSGAYSASKAAVMKWLESLRVELRGSGVSVVCICPGYVDTPMTRVNRFRMPFIIPADDFARRMARAVAAKRRLAVIPWQMAGVSVLLRLVPGWLYDRLAAHAPRKPKVPVT